jgi:hypothetical protein
MTNVERVSELKRLRAQVQNGDLRGDLHARRDILSSIVPLLNFDDVYLANARQFADILSQESFTNSMYESCEGRLDVIMGQAITELEHNLTPPPPPPPGLVPTPALTDEQGLWWFIQHCTTKTRWWMIVYSLAVLIATITAAYFAGRNHFINQVVDFWRQSPKP